MSCSSSCVISVIYRYSTGAPPLTRGSFRISNALVSVNEGCARFGILVRLSATAAAPESPPYPPPARAAARPPPRCCCCCSSLGTLTWTASAPARGTCGANPRKERPNSCIHRFQTLLVRPRCNSRQPRPAVALLPATSKSHKNTHPSKHEMIKNVKRCHVHAVPAACSARVGRLPVDINHMPPVPLCLGPAGPSGPAHGPLLRPNGGYFVVCRL